MQGTNSLIVQALLSGQVERCHTIQNIGSYKTSEHQWGVAMILFYLFPEHYRRLVTFALTHDIPEYWVGDIPATIKWYEQEVAKAYDNIENAIFSHMRIISPQVGLSEDEKVILRSCDILELYCWCRRQEALGNANASSFITEIKVAVGDGSYHEAIKTFINETDCMDFVINKDRKIREILDGHK